MLQITIRTKQSSLAIDVKNKIEDVKDNIRNFTASVAKTAMDSLKARGEHPENIYLEVLENDIKLHQERLDEHSARANASADFNNIQKEVEKLLS